MMATEVKRIKCAHCKGYHPSIEGVRQCSKVEQAQRAFVADLPSSTQRAIERAAPSHEPSGYVPEGRYAIVHEGTLKFYHVRRPTEGQWAGRTFIDVQAGDDFHKVASPRVRRTVLHLIGLDVQQAMLRYGQEIGACGHCGRTLTNEVSRLAGIGPVCRGRMGW